MFYDLMETDSIPTMTLRSGPLFESSHLVYTTQLRTSLIEHNLMSLHSSIEKTQ